MPADPLIIEKMRSTLPPYFRRCDIGPLTQNMFSSSYISKLNTAGEGPRPRYMGIAVFFEREEFLEWLCQYLANRGPVSPEDAMTQETYEE